MTRIRSRVGVTFAVLVLACASSSSAAPAKPAAASGASAKAACLAAHEQAQTLKTDKKLHAAREKFVVCARPECPVVLRKECTEQLDAMESVAPTVVLEALDDKGGSDVDVKVTVDGQVVAERLNGSALPVEPGEHAFVFERASDKKKLEQKILVVEGEKNRKVVADYETLLPKVAIPQAGWEAPAQPAREKKVPVIAYVAGGIAVVGLGSFAVFSLTGRGKEDDLSTRCAPHCTDTDLSPVKRDYLIGDISLGVAIVAAVAAVVLALPAFTRSATPRSAALGAPPWMPRVRRLQ